MANIEAAIIIAEHLFEMLNSPASKGMIESKSDLRKLRNNMSIIRNVLLDADKMQGRLSYQEQGLTKRIEDALYKADDLFDKFCTLAEVRQKGSKLPRKIHDLFATDILKMSKGVCSFREACDGFVADLSAYGLFRVDNLANITNTREETFSYLYRDGEAIVGRQRDVNAIFSVLSNDNTTSGINYFSIVGVGGIGKTTLAQLVFNHHLVQRMFDTKLWVCVSDQCGKKFNLKTILGKIIEIATGKHPAVGSTMERMRGEVEHIISERKCFLVLDDIWNEEYFEWCKLRNLLSVARHGSCVLVTTRSLKTANIIGNSPENMYELNGLSGEDSWDLFQMTAFERSRKETHPECLIIGKRIVEKCSGVPLAIKVLGSLLYDADIDKFRSFEDSGLAQIHGGENEVLSILKLSYHDLKPSVKCCFRYCALFPKNAEIEKEMLKSLWLAHGYIVASDGGQSVEDAAEEHFSILLRRCFFQDVKRDESGNVKCFKIHNLMHDVAQQVAGKEICVANSITSSLDPEVRHLFHAGEECTESSFYKLNVRSCNIDLGIRLSLVDKLVTNWQCLRSLGLSWSNSSDLPDSIGKLLHLRCLDLSKNSGLKTLPNSIGKLYNLETLSLRDCFNLEGLPKTLTKLLKLRYLDIHGCSSLACMPRGMEKLTSLCVLTDFVVDGESSKVEDLKTLVNVRGSIDIRIHTNVTVSTKGEGVLERMKHLNAVGIYFHPENNVEVAEVLMEKLKPHPNLREINLSNYGGLRAPYWGGAKDNWGTYLPNLIKIQLLNCERLDYLPSLSELKHLKSLEVGNLLKLNYMEELRSRNSFSPSEFPFFPSLKTLNIHQMRNLEEWCSSKNNPWKPIFPCLLSLRISDCPTLTSLPPCPNLESLDLMNSSKILRIKTAGDPSSSSSSSNNHPSIIKLDSLDYLDSLPVERLASLHLSSVLGSLSKAGEVFIRCSSSLRSLTFSECDKLKIPEVGLEQLTSLESLQLKNCRELNFEYTDVTPWDTLHNLRSLELIELPELKFLPEGMQFLINLNTLCISDCQIFEAIPEWISCLSSLCSLSIAHCPALISFPEAMRELKSLQKLKIEDCSYLSYACQEPNGENWHTIQHIPQISLI